MRLRPLSLLLPTLAAAVVLVLALALGKSGAATSVAKAPTTVVSHPTTVKIYMFAYEPDTLTVRAGTKITFHNMDQTAHTATAINQSFDTGTINPGKSKTIVVKKAGTYAYHCLFHEFMTGTLKVVG